MDRTPSRVLDRLSRPVALSLSESRVARLVYALCAVVLVIYTFAMGASSRMEPHKVWALFALLGYAAAAVMLLFRRSFRAVLAALVGLCVVVPFSALIVRDLFQHEVGIVGDGAMRMLATASPYVADPGTLNEVFPYFPLMSAFGMPSAVFGGGLLGDPRIYFTAFFVVVTWSTLRRLVEARLAVLVVVLLTVCPLVAIPISTGGVDLPIVALAALAVVTMWTGEHRLNAVAVGLGCAIKFTFWPLAAMAIVVQIRRGRGREIPGWSGVVAGIVVATVLPSALVDGTGFLRSAIEFPLGLADIESPAGAGLIGGPLSEHGVLGIAAIGAILLATSVAIAWRMLTKPQLNPADMFLLVAVGYAVLFLVSPVSRAGYFILPFVFVALSAVWRFSEAWRLGEERSTPSSSAPVSTVSTS